MVSSSSAPEKETDEVLTYDFKFQKKKKKFPRTFRFGHFIVLKKAPFVEWKIESAYYFLPNLQTTIDSKYLHRKQNFKYFFTTSEEK